MRSVAATTWLDNPPSLTVFQVSRRATTGGSGALVAKANNLSSAPGWSVYGGGARYFLTQQSGSVYHLWDTAQAYTDNIVRVFCHRCLTLPTPKTYVNGVLTGSLVDQAGTVTTTSNTASVTVGATDNGANLLDQVDVFEIIVWPYALSDSAVNYVGRMLCNKYADSSQGTLAPKWTDL